MKRTKVDSSVEKRLVISLITCQEYARTAVDIIDLDLIESAPLKMIAKWCIEYYHQYHKVPKTDIEGIFHAWSEKADEDEVDAIAGLLGHLSDESENVQENTEFLLDGLSEYLKSRQLKRVEENIAFHLAQNAVDRAEEVVQTYRAVNVAGRQGVDVMSDDAAWESAYAQTQESLLQFPGKSAKTFFGVQMARDSLIGVFAPPKRGKTWYCIEMADWGMRSGCKVAVFEVGDMTQNQIMCRFGTKFSRRPAYESSLGVNLIPRKFEEDEDGHLGISEHKEVVSTTVATVASVKKARQKYRRHYGISEKSPHLMVHACPVNTVNIDGIATILDQWAYENNFIPDIIIIDYPDILKAEAGVAAGDKLEKVNQTWMAMRRLSQERHACVIAPTQTNKASALAPTLTTEHVSDNQLKLAHVTGMLGLSQTPREKRAHTIRWNWILMRESEFDLDLQLHVGQCLSLGMAHTCSKLGYFTNS